MLVFHPDAEKIHDLSGWRVCLGGAKLTRQLAERAWQLGIRGQSAYGMTETCPAITTGQLKPEHFDLPMEEKLATTLRAVFPLCFLIPKL